MDREGFSDALRQARERHGWRQDELATKLSRRQSAVSNWEGGKSLPSAEDVFELERTLELDPGTLSRFLGYMPVGASAPGVETAIRSDEHLTPRLREQLVAIYYALRDTVSDVAARPSPRGRSRRPRSE